MHEEIVIKKEAIDIDDTKIKLELYDDAPQLELPFVDSFMNIIEERPDMITVPVHDYKTEDELRFIESMLDQPQKLYVTSSRKNDAALGCLSCDVCDFKCENYLALASHRIHHQLNRHFCRNGCGLWFNTFEEILEHEFRQHTAGVNLSNCRICRLACFDAAGLARHMSSHFFVRRFVCAICRRHFETKQCLQLHWKHSKELCGQVKYADLLSNVGQLVAVTTLDEKLPEDKHCDVTIKSEPLEADELPEQQLEAFEHIVIKTEPLAEVKESKRYEDSWASSNSLVEKLRGKLRLPSIKKPSQTETTQTKPGTIHPAVQISTAGSQKTVHFLSSKITPRQTSLLKPKVVNNQTKNVLQSIKNQPNIAGNILKVLPTNCMLFKLPPNTKIVKISPNTPRITTNKCAIGSKIISLPSAISIRPTLNQPPKQQKVAATVTTPTPVVPAESPVPTVTTVPTQGGAAQKSNLNRSAYFNALSLFDNLPESRKIITELQNKIRSIEQTLPLPGSVLQTPKRSKRLEVLRLPLTKESDVKVRELRLKHPNQRFHWRCPRCPVCYEQYFAFCNHLTHAHDIAADQFEKIEVDVKAYKKTKITQDLEETPSSSEDVEMPSEPAAAAVVDEDAPAADAVTEEAAPVAVPDPVPFTAPAPAPAGPPSAAIKPAAKSSRPGSAVRSAQYQCEDCSKCFTTVGGLRIHKMIHTGELPHKCNYCDKRFRTPGQVRVHQRRHTGEKPFKCKVCSLDFTHRETLISHLSRHIGMKRYKCYGCDKSFVVVSGLRAHRRLRPDTCGKVKFTARAHGPRVRVIRGEVVFESHPEHNGYLRSEDPLNIMSEIQQAAANADSS